MARKKADISPITDAGEAQQFDLAARMLRAMFVRASTFYVMIALLLAFKTNVSPVIAVLIPVVGIAGAVVTLRSLRPQNEARLANFTDAVTHERQLPGGQLPLPRWLGRHGTIAFLVAEIVVIVTIALSH